VSAGSCLKVDDDNEEYDDNDDEFTKYQVWNTDTVLLHRLTGSNKHDV
jgi:hypothetical protein